MLAKSLQYTKSSGLLERFGKPSLPRSAGVSLSHASTLSRVANASRTYYVLTPARMTGSTLAKEYIRRYASGATEEKDITVPGFGDSITEITVVQWAKNKGDQVKMDDVVCSIETDKLSNEIRAPHAGTIVDTYVTEGSTVAIGSKLYRLGPAKEGAASAPAAPAAKPAAAPQPAKEAAKPQEAAPQPAKEAAKPQAATPAAAPKPAAPAASAASTAQPVIADTSARTERRVPMKSLRKRVAERLKGAQNTYALLTSFNEIDMQEATEMRNKYKDLFVEKHGVKLGFMSAFVKASSQALLENPIVNAVIDGNDIVYRDYVDISCAVASPTGLLVPVLRNVDKLSFAGVERELGNLAKRAREGGITLEEMAGGTFTISNGGVYGSLMGTPIINPPQSAILGMHAINKRPVVVNDQITIRPMMYVALTYDHRLLDGKDAVIFLKRIKELVEDPRRLLLEC